MPVPFPELNSNDPVYKLNTEDEAVLFAEEFTKLQGKFAFCNNEQDLQKQLNSLFAERNFTKIYCSDPELKPLLSNLSIEPYNNLAGSDCSLTGCEYLVARTGSIVLSSQQTEGRTASVYAPVHICIAYNHQLVFDIKDALSFMKEKYKNNLPSFITFATGPSRTADIEKTLVTGVHGPKEVFCFLVEG